MALRFLFKLCFSFGSDSEVMSKIYEDPKEQTGSELRRVRVGSASVLCSGKGSPS